jgi:hypothetical protein
MVERRRISLIDTPHQRELEVRRASRRFFSVALSRKSVVQGQATARSLRRLFPQAPGAVIPIL